MSTPASRAELLAKGDQLPHQEQRDEEAGYIDGQRGLSYISDMPAAYRQGWIAGSHARAETDAAVRCAFAVLEQRIWDAREAAR